MQQAYVANTELSTEVARVTCMLASTVLDQRGQFSMIVWSFNVVREGRWSRRVCICGTKAATWITHSAAKRIDRLILEYMRRDSQNNQVLIRVAVKKCGGMP